MKKGGVAGKDYQTNLRDVFNLTTIQVKLHF